MKDIIKYSVIFFILLWSVTCPSMAEQVPIYIVKNGKLMPFKNTSDSSDSYYGRSTNSYFRFTKITKDKNGKEISE